VEKTPMTRRRSSTGAREPALYLPPTQAKKKKGEGGGEKKNNTVRHYQHYAPKCVLISVMGSTSGPRKGEKKTYPNKGRGKAMKEACAGLTQ